ncbi:MAG: branched-chain amino acid ABC transporter permease [Trueperaceae bacterium]
MNRSLLWVIALTALFIVCFWADASWNGYALRLFMYLGLYIALSVSLNLVNGLTDIFSLGHAAFMALGAYTSALLTLPLEKRASAFSQLPEWFQQLVLPFPVALIAGALVAMLVAVLIGFPLLRLRGHYLSVGTLALLVIVETLALNMTALTRGPRGINSIPVYTNVFWVWGVTVFFIYVVARFKGSSFGLALSALRQDDIAAEATGIPTAKYRLLAFVISAAMAGVVGGLWAHLVRVISPHVFSYNITFLVVAMLVIGGLGSISGSVIGAAILFLIPEGLRFLESGRLFGMSQLLVALMLIVIMIFRPQGIFGRREIFSREATGRGRV